MKQTKEKYVSPSIEVIQVENEGVIAASVGEIPVKPMNSSISTGNRSYNSASGSDLEDMINDILTVGE